VLLTTDILALELRPGTLLRITTNTSAEQFSSAALAGDARATAGHLVSIIAANHSVDAAPLALLASYVQTALLKMHAAETDFHQGQFDTGIRRFCVNLCPLHGSSFPLGTLSWH